MVQKKLPMGPLRPLYNSHTHATEQRKISRDEYTSAKRADIETPSEFPRRLEEMYKKNIKHGNPEMSDVYRY